MLENIQELCKQKGIGVSRLERDLNFGKGSIYKWDKNSPSIDKVQKVAEYFNVPVDFLLGSHLNRSILTIAKAKQLKSQLEEVGIIVKFEGEDLDTVRIHRTDGIAESMSLSDFAEKGQAILERYDDDDDDIHTIAAHHDGTEWTEEELEEIERFKEFVKTKREQRIKE